eukprot:m.23893 g.23893  ORF g.23893 m.23893 type:complete len:488 (-) comp9044_c0_seq1:108-1571(-)
MSSEDPNWKRTAAEASVSTTAAKRPHTDDNPSPVLLITNIPIGYTNTDVTQALSAFGGVVNVRTAGTQKVLAEMQSIDIARSILSTNLNIGGHTVNTRFSQYKKLLDVTPNDVPPSCLIVRVTNLGHPLSLSILHQLFSRFGRVMRIVCFMKQNFLQILVQMDSPKSAADVKTSLHNVDLYTNSCHAEVEFSKLTEVTVRQANFRARDFIASPLQPGEQLSTQAINPIQPTQQFQQQQQPQQQMYSGQQGYGMMGGNHFQANPFGMGSYQQSGMSSSMGQPGCVVRVQNLTPEIQLDQLFMLFGVYGDVMRIKQVHKDPSQALIQFASPQQANSAISFLNNIRFLGCQLRVSHSKFPMVHLAQDTGATKDYSKSKIHRYKNPETLKHIHPPSKVLYLHRLHPNPSAESVAALFREIGVEPEGVMMFEGKRMAFVQLKDVEQAAFCLVGLHNKLDGGSYLRVSFSRHNSINDDNNNNRNSSTSTTNAA